MDLEQVKQAILKTRNDVVSIVVFGSYARSGTYHDIDLLVVVEQNWKRRLDRRPALVELRKSLPRLGADIDMAQGRSALRLMKRSAMPVRRRLRLLTVGLKNNQLITRCPAGNRLFPTHKGKA